MHHRDDDLPAVRLNGTQHWCKHTNKHTANDLPAIIISNGDQHWYKHTNKHTANDLPAIILSNGTQYWYKHTNKHTANDLPAIILSNGTQYWYKPNKIHGDSDLPAVIFRMAINNRIIHQDNNPQQFTRMENKNGMCMVSGWGIAFKIKFIVKFQL
jgi:hypothetical protein